MTLARRRLAPDEPGARGTAIPPDPHPDVAALQARLALALQASELGTFDWDLERGVAEWDARCKTIFGLSQDATVDYAGFLGLVHPQDRDRVDRACRAALDSLDGGFDADYRIRWPNGRTVRAIEARGQVLFGGAGRARRPTRFVGTVLDVTEREHSAERWRGLSAASPAGIFEADLEGRVAWVNPRLAQIWGRPAEALLDTQWVEGVHPDDRGPLLAGWTAANAQGREYAHEFRVLRADGEARWVHGRSAPLRDGQGRAIATVGTVEDVTERHAAELAARALAAEREATLGQMTDGVIVADADGRIRFVNAAAARLHGTDRLDIPAEAYAAQCGLRTLDGGPYPSARVPLVRAVLDGETVRDERWRIVRPDGSEAIAQGSAAPVVDQHGDRLGAVLVMRDVTVEQATREALAASEARFRAMADNIPNLAWMADPSGWIYWFNQRWLDYTGLTLQQTCGEGWAVVQHPDHVDRVVAGWRRACGQGVPWEDTLPMRSADGQWRWFLSRAEPIRGASGGIERWFATCTDVSEQREADARKDEFLAMLAHELRNPLAPVLNAVRYLQRGAALDAAGSRALAMIERQARQMGRLVDDLLEVGRITRGRIEIRPEPMLLGSAVNAAAETVLPAIEARGQRLEIALPSEPMRLSADPVRLAQVLENLLANASKYTPPGGSIRVDARRAGDEAEVRVVDSGIGIAPSDLDRVFEPFVQLDATLDRSQGGLGIGLALVAHLVRLHGGSVRAESEGLGKGATFVVRLPLGPRPRRAG